MIDLIKAIAKRLKEQYGAKEVILFGPYAKGNPHEDSALPFSACSANGCKSKGNTK